MILNFRFIVEEEPEIRFENLGKFWKFRSVLSPFLEILIYYNFPPLRCKHILMYINTFHYFGHSIKYSIKHLGEIFTDILLLGSQELLLRGNLPPDNLLFERFVQLNIKIPV